MVISSSSNDRVKELKKLFKSSKDRNEKGLYVVEGIRMFREIPDELMSEVYVSEGALAKNEDILRDKAGDDCIVLTDSVFKSVADTGTPQGIAATVRMKEYTLDDVCRGTNPFILIIERLQDPGNMGTIIRSAEAAGVTGIIVSPDCVDIYNPKVVRSTMGSIFRVPVYRSGDIVADISVLKDNNIEIYGAHLDGSSIYDVNLKKPAAFLIGNEGNGLSEEVSKTADRLIRIPMLGQVESLNAAISASVIAYEVLRQRL